MQGPFPCKNATGKIGPLSVLVVVTGFESGTLEMIMRLAVLARSFFSVRVPQGKRIVFQLAFILI